MTRGNEYDSNGSFAAHALHAIEQLMHCKRKLYVHVVTKHEHRAKRCVQQMRTPAVVQAKVSQPRSLKRTICCRLGFARSTGLRNQLAFCRSVASPSVDVYSVYNKLQEQVDPASCVNVGEGDFGRGLILNQDVKESQAVCRAAVDQVILVTDEPGDGISVFGEISNAEVLPACLCA